MMRLFDFKCEQCGKSSEHLVQITQLSMLCICGGEMRRLVSTPTIRLDGISGDFPSASDRWANVREQNARIKAKRAN